jgi:hypothetical protein
MLMKWREFLRITIDIDCNPALVASRYKRIITELLDMDIFLDIDTIGPLQSTPSQTIYPLTHNSLNP